MSYLSRMEIPAGLSALRRQQARWVCAGTLAAASTLYVASPSSRSGPSPPPSAAMTWAA
ncbi:hypothetical protein RAA17_02335 [Komagataeibacter rhaeticus]|nr:hypothetical protein [Komagataeibacter rhaeticus]